MSLFNTINGFVSVDYRENTKTIWNLILGWKYFLETEVVVGITEESNASREGGFTNAGLLYMHEQGVPSHNIPARPVLKPAIAQEKVKEEIETMMRDAAVAALVDGDRDTAEKCFEKAGMLGRDACKNYILGGNLAPNAPSTIARKGSSQPLVDTGSLLGSISYAVRKK